MKNGTIWQWVVGILIGLLMLMLGIMWQIVDTRFSLHTAQINDAALRVGKLETQADIQFGNIERRLDNIERKIDALNAVLAAQDVR